MLTTRRRVKAGRGACGAAPRVLTRRSGRVIPSAWSDHSPRSPASLRLAQRPGDPQGVVRAVQFSASRREMEQPRGWGGSIAPCGRREPWAALSLAPAAGEWGSLRLTALQTEPPWRRGASPITRHSNGSAARVAPGLLPGRCSTDHQAWLGTRGRPLLGVIGATRRCE